MISDILTFFGVDATGKTREQVDKKIKRAYRRLARKHHPDLGGDPAEFRKAQDAYDLYQKHAAEYAPRAPGETRAAAIIFFAFRDFLLANKEFNEQALNTLAQTDDEWEWLVHFAGVAEGAGFLFGQTLYSTRSPTGTETRFSVLFLDKSITLPRFYRAYALKSLRGSELFNEIERMFVKDVPWNFHRLRALLTKGR